LSYTAEPLLPAAQEADIIIANFLPVRLIPLVREKLLVVDLFAQYFAEWMELTLHEHQGLGRHLSWLERRAYIALQLALADMVMCSNERQRQSYIGALASMGLRKPVVVALHGIRPDPPVKRRAVLKGVRPGIAPTDKVLIWNGGTTDWYDPDSFLLALHTIAQRRGDVKAVFLGATYPNVPRLGWGKRFRSALEAAHQLGLYGATVFFQFGWVPYDEVPDYLLEAEAGVCTYMYHLETYYSLRTRFMDLFWAGLPIICTRGDFLADLIEREGLGIAVPPGNHKALAEAILRLLDDDSLRSRMRQNIQRVRERFSWEKTLEPLIQFCRNVSLPKRPRNRRVLLRALPWAVNYLATRSLREMLRGEEVWVLHRVRRVATRLGRLLEGERP